jgi:hypothetical protein
VYEHVQKKSLNLYIFGKYLRFKSVYLQI